MARVEEAHFVFVLPIILSISFLLIADIDSLRGGIIRAAAEPTFIVAFSDTRAIHSGADRT